jgi:hypothetical protein
MLQKTIYLNSFVEVLFKSLFTLSDCAIRHAAKEVPSRKLHWLCVDFQPRTYTAVQLNEVSETSPNFPRATALSQGGCETRHTCRRSTSITASIVICICSCERVTYSAVSLSDHGLVEMWLADYYYHNAACCMEWLQTSRWHIWDVHTCYLDL